MKFIFEPFSLPQHYLLIVHHVKALLWQKTINSSWDPGNVEEKLNIWEDEENDKVEQKENEIVVKIIQWISTFLLQLHAHSTVWFWSHVKKKKVTF
jgi:hypothetical protein